jgi:hypothetical protein
MGRINLGDEVTLSLESVRRPVLARPFDGTYMAAIWKGPMSASFTLEASPAKDLKRFAI